MQARLLAISNSRSLAVPFATWLDAVAEAGLPLVQLREKHLSDRALYELALATRRRLPSTTRLLINGRADIAVASGAAGVHLPSTAAPTSVLRKAFGSSLLWGRSTHGLAEIRRESEAGTDYVTFGPIFETPGEGKATPQGLDTLAEASSIGPPVFALGGVSRDRIDACLAAGAWGVAGIRLVQGESLRAVADHPVSRPSAATPSTGVGQRTEAGGEPLEALESDRRKGRDW